MSLFIQNLQVMENKISLLISGKLGFNLLIDLFKYNDIEFVATLKTGGYSKFYAL